MQSLLGKRSTESGEHISLRLLARSFQEREKGGEVPLMRFQQLCYFDPHEKLPHPASTCRGGLGTHRLGASDGERRRAQLEEDGSQPSSPVP
jgi:hypothetical protein